MKLQDLFITTIIREVSDRFGLPVMDGDDYTPSGLPLNDSPANAANAERWAGDMTERFDWLAKSDAIVDESDALDVVDLIVGALDDDGQAIEQLRKVA